jgi:hypothetical protein
MDNGPRQKKNMEKKIEIQKIKKYKYKFYKGEESMDPFRKYSWEQKCRQPNKAATAGKV